MALFPQVGRKQLHVRLGWYAVVSLLVLGVILHLTPFYLMLTMSIKSGRELLSLPPTIFPHRFTLAAWDLIFQVAQGANSILPNPFIRYFWNSLFITGMTLLLSLPITAFAAYTSSKLLTGPLARWTFLFLIGTMMVPGVVTLLPHLLMVLHFPFAMPDGSIPRLPGGDPFPSLRFWDTPWAIIVPGIFSAFNFLLFKGFFDTIPNSVLQAARVDGGSEFNIFRRIVLPMSVPVFAVAAWTQFGTVWDGNLLWTSLVFQSDEKIPTSLAIYRLINLFTQSGVTSPEMAQQQSHLIDAGLGWNGLIVLGILQTLPIFLMFIVCREFLLKGIRIRGLK